MPEAIAEIEPLFRAWLLRHEMPDAYARWRESQKERAPVLAFTAVACDGKLLHRLGSAGSSLAEQAQRFAEEVTRQREASDQARAAAQIVRVRVQQWRQRSASTPPQEVNLGASPAPAAVLGRPPLTLEEYLRIALDDHPRFRESAARALFEETLRLAGAGLQVIGEPFDSAMMLASARFASRAWRGLIRTNPPGRDACMTAVALVQQWAARTGKNPLAIEFSGTTGALDDLALAMYREVATCLAISAGFSGGAHAPGFGMWEVAEEHLAFAVLSLRPNQLANMQFDQAQTMAAAAARLATRALEDPSAPVPTFPTGTEAGGPRMVLATTRFALPNGVGPRRSAMLAA